MFWDKLLGQLQRCKAEDLIPLFNAIYVPELSRLSRQGSKIWEVVEVCRFYGLRLIDKSIVYNYADAKMVHALGSMAAEAENETMKMGQRLSESEAYRFDRYRTLSGQHYGFRVQNIKGTNNRVISSRWVRIEIEIKIIMFLYDEFPRHPNFNLLARMVKENFDFSITSQQVREILTTTKYLGIIYRRKRRLVIDIETETPVYREEQISPEVFTDLTPADKPPYKYFIPELVVITIDKWRAVQEIICRRQVNIKKNPANPNRSHRPAREHGKTALSGLLTCGCCQAPMVLYGPSNTALFACQNGRKRRCGQNRSVRADTIRAFLIPGLQKLLDEHLPLFLREYKIQFQSRIQSLIAERRDLERLVQKRSEDIKTLTKGAEALSTPQRLRLQGIIDQEMAKLNELETKVKSRENQIEFLKSNVDFERAKAMQWVNSLETLIMADPTAANEALRKIIDRIEVHVRRSEENAASGLSGRIIFKVEGLGRFFSGDLNLRDFVHSEASTDQFQTIVSDRSVEGNLAVKFQIEVLPVQGTQLNEIGTTYKVAWRFVRQGPDLSTEFFVSQVSDTGIYLLPNPINLIAARISHESEKIVKVVRLISYPLFDDDESSKENAA